MRDGEEHEISTPKTEEDGKDSSDKTSRSWPPTSDPAIVSCGERQVSTPKVAGPFKGHWSCHKIEAKFPKHYEVVPESTAEVGLTTRKGVLRAGHCSPGAFVAF